MAETTDPKTKRRNSTLPQPTTTDEPAVNAEGIEIFSSNDLERSVSSDDLRAETEIELTSVRSYLLSKRHTKIQRNLEKESKNCNRVRVRSKRPFNKAPASLLSIKAIENTPKLRPEILPPHGIQWVRARNNVRLPDGYESSFYIPYVDESEENILEATVIAKDLFEDESDADDDSDVEGWTSVDTGNGGTTPVKNRHSSKRVVRSGKRKVADLIWDRAAKRLTVYRILNRYNNPTSTKFIDAISKGLSFSSKAILRQFITVINKREEVWIGKASEKRQVLASAKRVINVIQGFTDVTATQALRGDSILFFFCRRCYVFNCTIHGHNQSIGPTTKIPDRTRKDSVQKLISDTIESTCADKNSNTCWHIKEDEPPRKESSSWWSEFQKENDNFAEDIKMLLIELLPIFGKDFCRLSEMIRVAIRDNRDKNVITCERIGHVSVAEFEHLLTKAQLPTARTKPLKARIAKPTVESRAIHEGTRPDYWPCHHEGPCTKETCDCVKQGVHCEKYCGCNHNRPNQPRNASVCHWAFKGCTCRSSAACISKACVCFSWKRECDPDLCKSCHECRPSRDGGQRISCRNVGLQYNKGHRTVAGWSNVHGWGVFATGNIAKNEIVGEYVGEIIEDQDAERRGRVYDLHNSNYLFSMTNRYSLDSSRLGNKLRYCNHSSFPNCEARLMRVNGDMRVGIFARCEIRKYEELFFDYGPAFAKKLKIAKKRKQLINNNFQTMVKNDIQHVDNGDDDDVDDNDDDADNIDEGEDDSYREDEENRRESIDNGADCKDSLNSKNSLKKPRDKSRSIQKTHDDHPGVSQDTKETKGPHDTKKVGPNGDLPYKKMSSDRLKRTSSTNSSSISIEHIPTNNSGRPDSVNKGTVNGLGPSATKEKDVGSSIIRSQEPQQNGSQNHVDVKVSSTVKKNSGIVNNNVGDEELRSIHREMNGNSQVRQNNYQPLPTLGTPGRPNPHNNTISNGPTRIRVGSENDVDTEPNELAAKNIAVVEIDTTLSNTFSGKRRTDDFEHNSVSRPHQPKAAKRPKLFHNSLAQQRKNIQPTKTNEDGDDVIFVSEGSGYRNPTPAANTANSRDEDSDLKIVSEDIHPKHKRRLSHPTNQVGHAYHQSKPRPSSMVTPKNGTMSSGEGNERGGNANTSGLHQEEEKKYKISQKVNSEL